MLKEREEIIIKLIETAHKSEKDRIDLERQLNDLDEELVYLRVKLEECIIIEEDTKCELDRAKIILEDLNFEEDRKNLLKKIEELE